MNSFSESRGASGGPKTIDVRVPAADNDDDGPRGTRMIALVIHDHLWGKEALLLGKDTGIMHSDVLA